MARRYINTSQFNPYTFQELWQPAEAATQAHMQQAASYADLSSKAALLGNFISPERDPEEYRAWEEYTTNLRRGSDDLMRKGLSGTTFNTLWQSSVDYGAKIKPIELAVENKQKFAQILNQTALQHPNALFVRDAEDYALRDYRNGIPQPELIDIDAVRKEAAAIASIYADDRVRFGNPEQFDRFRQIITQKYGDTFEEALNNIQDPSQLLYQIKQMVLESNGANRLLENGKQAGYDRLNRAVDEAIIAGAVGKTVKNLDDTYFNDSLKAAEYAETVRMHNYTINAARQQAAMEAAEKKTADYNSLTWTYGKGVNSRRQEGVAMSSTGKDAIAWQEAILDIFAGNGGLDHKFEKITGIRDKDTISNVGSEKDARFGLEFKAVDDNGRRAPYFLMNWNGDMYKIPPEYLLDPTMSETIQNRFGETVKSTASAYDYSVRALVDEYRSDPDKFSDNDTEIPYMMPDGSIGRATKNAMLQDAITGITLAAQNRIYAVAKASQTDYKQKIER